jgi:D-tyrosyl-tRNA(Tyr) deacylase
VKTVIQRVAKAILHVDGAYQGEIGAGLVVLAGFAEEDTEAELEKTAEKIAALRIFEDEQGKMNLDLAQINGELMVVPQFTLYGDCRRGNRPDFTKAGKPETARLFYEKFLRALQGKVKKLVAGRFASHMLVEIHNDGPVTLLLESSPKQAGGASDEP